MVNNQNFSKQSSIFAFLNLVEIFGMDQTELLAIKGIWYLIENLDLSELTKGIRYIPDLQ